METLAWVVGRAFHIPQKKQKKDQKHRRKQDSN